MLLQQFPVRLLLPVLLLLPMAAFAALAVWVYDDARHRGSDSPLLWAFAGVFSPLLVVYLLLVAVGHFQPRSAPPERRERLAGTLGFGVTAGFVLASVLSPPDPASQVLWLALSLTVTLPVAYLLTGRVGGDPRLQTY
ncbi:hypothetical protein [Natronomonas sp. EA1]|uniref:hypothetical protein n=1 Tax=Natronomonas sp. EA1 TaxID=3421655 RepID=UPI003EBC93E1